jgi:hypothetical protein
MNESGEIHVKLGTFHTLHFYHVVGNSSTTDRFSIFSKYFKWLNFHSQTQQGVIIHIIIHRISALRYKSYSKEVK